MYTDVDSIVRAALAEKGYRTLHRYVLYLHFALEGLYRAKRDGAFKSIKKVKLKVSSRNSISWPKDMLEYGRVGVPVGNRVLTFIPDNTISLSQEDHANDNNFSVVQGFPLSAGLFDSMFDFLTWTNVYLSNNAMVGSGAGSFISKRFRVNQSQREFQLDSGIGARHIYLEYLSSGNEPNCQTVFSHHVGLQLKEFIHYREARFKLGAGSPETKASEQDYLNELDESLAAQSDVTMNGILSALSISTRNTIAQ